MGILIEINSFLDDYKSMRKHRDTLSYDGVTSPVDNVFYPGVSLDIPQEVKDEIKQKLDDLFGQVKINYLFLRLSPKGVHAPHQAHNDESMGDHSLMLYLNQSKHCEGGTSFVSHKSGNDIEMWTEDCNKPYKWNIDTMCHMEENKACIFDAARMHRSEPVGGFGYHAKNARLVLVCFFDAKEESGVH